VAEGVEGGAAEHVGGGVAEAQGDEALDGVVEGDREQKDDVLEDRQGDFQIHRL